MASDIYDNGLDGISSGSVDWVNDDIRVLLVVNAYVFSRTHSTVSSVVASEVTASGYARKVVAGQTENFNQGAREFRFNATDPVWVSIDNNTAESSKAGIFYKFVTNDADSTLIAYVEDASAITFNKGLVTLALGATGAFKITG